jgi:uncharacterized membrane protein YkoI
MRRNKEMKKKTGLVIGSVAIAGVLGFSVLQSFADETEPIVQDTTTEAASEVQTTEAESKTEEVQESWYDEVLTIQEAKEKAHEEFQGKVIEIELDHDDGRLLYEINLVDETSEVEIEMDAVTGEIFEKEKERADRDKQLKAQANVLTIQEAKEIAQAEFAGKVIEMELDEDDGRFVYEMELVNNNSEAEIDMDAETGEILELEIEQ